MKKHIRPAKLKRVPSAAQRENSAALDAIVKSLSLTIDLKCILCNHREAQAADKIPKDGPVCPKCYGPMIPVRASSVPLR